MLASFSIDLHFLKIPDDLSTDILCTFLYGKRSVYIVSSEGEHYAQKGQSNTKYVVLFNFQRGFFNEMSALILSLKMLVQESDFFNLFWLSFVISD